MKANSGQAPSTLIPEYIGSVFDKVITVVDNIETVTEVADSLNHIKAVDDNLGIINTVLSNIDEIVVTSSNIKDVKSVATSMDSIKTAENKLENIITVADNITDVATVSANMGYVKGVAEGIGGLPVISYIGDEPPTRPLNGAEWYCTTDGRTYVWYTDADSGQWVESSPQSVIETDPSIAHTVANSTENIFELWKRSAAEAGLNLVNGSFEEGGVLTSSIDVLLHKESKSIYAWSGAFPKIVSPSTDPAASSSGYTPRTDAVLRNELSSPGGAELSLSQVATAYGIPFGKLAVWSAGAASDLTKYWLYDNKVWQSNAFPHSLESVPSFATAHVVPVDGILYPDHFGASYIAGADQTPALQRMETWQASRNAPLRLRAVEHTLLTKLIITRAPCIVCEAGGFGVTTASPSSGVRRSQGAVLIGKVAGDFSLEVAPTSFEFGGQICNVTITGKSSSGATKTAGKGVRLHNFGWSARVSGFSVLDFNGTGLEIGYLQDTVFDQLSVLGCGPTSAQRAMMFTSNSNYLYFNNAHIEDGNYLLGCAGAVDKPWEIHWNGCHFESGDYNGAQGAEFDHSYTAPPVEFDGCYRWYLNDATMVPASVQRLQSVNGGDTASQPYFMSGADTSRITGSMRFICPRNGGGIDAIQLTGNSSGNHFSRIDVEGAQGAKYCVVMESGTVNGGSMTFTVPSEVKLFGININRGRIDSIRFANSAGGSAKTSGYLINSSFPAGLVSGEHFYEMGTAPYRWVNQYVHSVDTRINDYTNVVNGGTIDMEAVRPDNALYNGTSGATVANIINCQRSRRIKFRNNTGGTLTITGTASVKNDGAGDFVIPAYSSYMMKADHTGVLYKD